MVRLFLCLKGGVDMKNEYKFSDAKKICTIFFIDRTSFTIDANNFELVSKYTWFKGKRGYPTAHFIDFFLSFLKMLILIILTEIK